MPGADGKSSACFNENKESLNVLETVAASSADEGGSMMVQCGGPTTTQMARGGSAGSEFIAVTDHSVLLQAHNDSLPPMQWGQNSFSGFGTTNWQSPFGGSTDERLFTAQAYASTLGTPGNVNHEGNDSPHSMMSLGYTSYFIQKEGVNIGDQQFFVSSPSSSNYFIDGCPNLKPGQTSANTNFVCPRKSQKVGAFKFTVIGLLSGSKINSLNTAFPASQTSTRQWGNADRDIGQYKTMLYRSTLDVGGMGAGVVTKLVGNCTEAGKDFAAVNPNADLADCSLSITGAKHGEISLEFTKYYSTGRYNRSKADLVAEFGYPCNNDNGNHDGCTRDLTGFGSPPDSYPGTNVKKLGTSATPKAVLRGMAGAPELAVEEVKAMKITMMPNACSGRPAAPAAQDATGMSGAGWVGAPSGCPWWYLSTATREGQLVWSVDRNVNHNSSPEVRQDDMTECVSGSCYVIDFHIELGGTTEASRTVFGNPPNAIENGWDKGVFFIYDPRVTTGPIQYNWWVVVGIFVAVFFGCCCMGSLIWYLCCKEACCCGCCDCCGYCTKGDSSLDGASVLKANDQFEGDSSALSKGEEEGVNAL